VTRSAIAARPTLRAQPTVGLAVAMGWRLAAVFDREWELILEQAKHSQNLGWDA
jgi:hypothetical protein